MDITAGGRVLEVGSGPGWVTEILIMLGFEVDGIEPSDRMIAIAEDRVRACIAHHRLKNPPRVTFHCQTLEDCRLPDNQFDGALFHESLHHIVDEHKGLAQCARMLKPGGVLGVSEAAWQPGDHRLEDVLRAEMARYGTLENPYSKEYLDALLLEHGFKNIQRYHGINGLFPAEKGYASITRLAQFPADGSNILTAVKSGGPYDSGPHTTSARALTKAKITVLKQRFEESSLKVRLKVKLVNHGQTVWLHRPRGLDKGLVNLGLRQGQPGSPNFREARDRQPLPETVVPNQAITLDVAYYLPPDYRRDCWYLDLVSENCFWFYQRGTKPAEIRFA